MTKKTRAAQAANDDTIIVGKTGLEEGVLEINPEEFIENAQTPTQKFGIWIVGQTPLIVHAWSQKAREEMLNKHIKRPRQGKEIRSPEQDFENSLYVIREAKDGKEAVYGFPATGVKNAILSSAHKDKGIPRSVVMGALWINAQMVRTKPAYDQSEKGGRVAICDLPLLRIYGSPPEMREDMVKIGAGLNKIANLAYRAQFRHWAMFVKGEYNPAVITQRTLSFLISAAGISAGIGDWRNERKGMFGSFRPALSEEHKLWTDYARGQGPLPLREDNVEEDEFELAQAAE